MWGSDDKWQDLERRVSDLEQRLVRDADNLQFTVFEDGEYGERLLYPIRRKSIPVREVVRRILAHLGMKLKYTAGTEEFVDFVRKPK
jgi:hypothetical protein